MTDKNPLFDTSEKPKLTLGGCLGCLGVLAFLALLPVIMVACDQLTGFSDSMDTGPSRESGCTDNGSNHDAYVECFSKELDRKQYQ